VQWSRSAGGAGGADAETAQHEVGVDREDDAPDGAAARSGRGVVAATYSEWGSEDGRAGPNGWTKGGTEAGGKRKGSTGKPENSEPRGRMLAAAAAIVVGGCGWPYHEDINRGGSPCGMLLRRCAAASKTWFVRRLLRPARGS
jgi:hypothetical protein